MSTPSENDPALARFRRGASTPAGPVGPPPPLQGDRSAPPPVVPLASPVVPPAPPVVLPAPPSIQPLFADVLGSGAGQPSGVPLYDEPDYDWAPDEPDPGRTSGIVGFVIGIFIGVVGLVVGILSVRSSRRDGRVGGWGIAAIVVSLASMAVVAGVSVSYARYEISLANQCSVVGPGSYLTQSGTQVTCR
ncbi:DUF4190 domain-containing protein [Frondihabitans cladoniiphilus]|uniref:DUF4190 domain-containing protein n=1 Tax=Frondihabitans cladoniiphilus TaxID=715785 RepID=A0ABP8VXH9_9MICO